MPFSASSARPHLTSLQSICDLMMTQPLSNGAGPGGKYPVNISLSTYISPIPVETHVAGWGFQLTNHRDRLLKPFLSLVGTLVHLPMKTLEQVRTH